MYLALDVVAHVGQALVDALGIEIDRDDGNLEPLGEQQGELRAMSPAPTIPTLRTGSASDLSGTPTGFLARRCTRSKE